jgi:hypothetical protein
MIFFFCDFFSRRGLLNSYSRSAYAENSHAVCVCVYIYGEAILHMSVFCVETAPSPSPSVSLGPAHPTSGSDWPKCEPTAPPTSQRWARSPVSRVHHTFARLPIQLCHRSIWGRHATAIEMLLPLIAIGGASALSRCLLRAGPAD